MFQSRCSNCKFKGSTCLLYTSTWNVKERLVYRPIEQLKLTARGGYYFRERDKTGDSKDRYRDFSGGLKANYDFCLLDTSRCV